MGDSLALAWYSAKYDFIGTQGVDDAPSHSMTPNGPGWTEETAQIVRDQFVDEQIAKGTNEGLGYAIHTMQDEASASHGWKGYCGDVSAEHVMKDAFPSDYRYKWARENTIAVLKRAGKCGSNN